MHLAPTNQAGFQQTPKNKPTMPSYFTAYADRSPLFLSKRFSKKLVTLRRSRKKHDIKASTIGMKEMEMENLKLYLENSCIMEENRRLGEKALLLRQENRALLCHLAGGHAATLNPPFSQS